MRVSAKKAILFGIESSYNTDPTLDATNAIWAQNFQMVPFQSQMLNRDAPHANFGSDIEAVAELYRTITFDIPFSGAGAAGTAPLYGPMLRTCGLSETITASTKVEYAPISASQESAYSYFYLDGELRKLGGIRGNASLKFQGGQLPMLSFTPSGLIPSAADADTAFPSGLETQLSSFVKALPVNKANTTTASLLSYAVELESFELNFGNAVLFRDRPNGAYIALTNRSATGSIGIAAPTLTAKNFGSLFRAGTTGALQIVHGATAGNIVQVDAPVVQLGAPADADFQGVAGLTIPLGFKRSTAGNDEFKLTVK